jgi:hypothetical protein
LPAEGEIVTVLRSPTGIGFTATVVQLFDPARRSAVCKTKFVAARGHEILNNPNGTSSSISRAALGRTVVTRIEVLSAGFESASTALAMAVFVNGAVLVGSTVRAN